MSLYQRPPCNTPAINEGCTRSLRISHTAYIPLPLPINAERYTTPYSYAVADREGAPGTVLSFYEEEEDDYRPGEQLIGT